MLLIMEGNEKSESKNWKVRSDLINGENIKVAIAQLCNELQLCNFTMLWLTQK